MTAFMIDKAHEEKLKAAAERARLKPIPWNVLQHSLPDRNQETDTLTLADRKQRVPPREPETVILPLSWRVAITCEEQPAGILLHLSMSSPRKGRIPRPEAMMMVVDACGYQADDIVRMWREEFEPGHFAVNLLLLVEERKMAEGMQ